MMEQVPFNRIQSIKYILCKTNRQQLAYSVLISCITCPIVVTLVVTLVVPLVVTHEEVCSKLTMVFSEYQF